ncbi:MAG: MFS transporter [Planctomycetota bacterium]|nr:MFS transporter [Planctomycetota bacterium]
MSDEIPRAKSPWSFVPTLYVLQGMNSMVVQTAANTYFAVLQLPLADIGKYSSDLTLPFMLKPLWSPLVDLYATKRLWLVLSAVAAAAAMFWLASAVRSSDPVRDVVFACTALALAGATNDIATDGYYILALDKREQEFFVGVRSSAFRLGMVAVQGGAVWLAGHWASGATADALGLELKKAAFSRAFLATAGVYAAFTLWHAAFLPTPANDRSTRGTSSGFAATKASIAEYFTKPGIVGAIAFILFYRAAETMLTPMIQPFLLGKIDAGGLGISTERVGLLNGTYGVIALLVGGILGGMLVSRIGLKRAIWPMAVAMHVPNVLFALAARMQFGELGAACAIVVEKFGYGIGLAAYMAALLSLSRGSRYSTTHYAISTGIMALSAWIAGRYSGALAAGLGFEIFFWMVCVLGLLGLATLPFFPHEKPIASERPVGG